MELNKNYRLAQLSKEAHSKASDGAFYLTEWIGERKRETSGRRNI